MQRQDELCSRYQCLLLVCVCYATTTQVYGHSSHYITATVGSVIKLSTHSLVDVALDQGDTSPVWSLTDTRYQQPGDNV